LKNNHKEAAQKEFTSTVLRIDIFVYITKVNTSRCSVFDDSWEEIELKRLRQVEAKRKVADESTVPF